MLAFSLGTQSLPGGEPSGNLTHEQRKELNERVRTLEQQALDLSRKESYAEAIHLAHQVLTLSQQLYPKDQYPQGHSELANKLYLLALFLRATGEYAQAEAYMRDALAMRQKLHPKDKYPTGHLTLAGDLHAMGSLLHPQAQDLYWKGRHAEAIHKVAEAETYHRDALAVRQKLYPKDKYPHGHERLAFSLFLVGYVLGAQGMYYQADQAKLAEADAYYRDALAMFRRLYPKDKYPHGHADLARFLSYLGQFLDGKGEHAQAEAYWREVLAMRQHWYPKDKYSQGHGALAAILSNVGFALWQQGKYAEAEVYYRDTLAMYHDLAIRVAQSAPEAQALNFLVTFPRTREVFLSLTRCLRGSAENSYSFIWQTKATLTRVYYSRHMALLATESPHVQQLWQQLLSLRRQRERLLLTPVPANPHARDQTLAQLNRQIDQLDLELLPLLPAVARAEKLARSRPSDLQAHLPPHTVLIDLLRYRFMEQDPKTPGVKGFRDTPSYVAYVVTRVQVQRVELGPAEPIEEAVHAWRQALTAWKASLGEVARRDLERSAAEQAQKLRRLVWDPLAPLLPGDTQAIYLAPDIALTQVPWSALPGKGQGTILLEDYALAVLPHGPYLLDQLTAPARKPFGADTLLVVGGVRYDDQPIPPATVAKPDEVAQRAMLPTGDRLWDYLEGSERELRQVSALVPGRVVRQLSGAEASTERLLAELPQARWVHLATHGFFADRSFRSVLQLNEKLFGHRNRLGDEIGERTGEGARNPLVLSGLVLAGANQRNVPDRGILTADAIVGLNLSGLDLAVLSACETGLGDVADGEGVFGLQRAFHMAGTKNVIASLWKVDDQATAALMTLFYRNLWQEKLPPLEALRQAQLALYHHPERIGELARGRGVEFDNLVRLPTDPANKAKESRSVGKAPPKLWAGFVLSGTGR